MSFRTGLAALMATLLYASAASAATIYVDDDAAGDPGPGTPAVSDPAEDGSPAHPFDAIQEAIDAALAGDEVVVLPGTYTGDGNRDIEYRGKAITVRGMDPSDENVVRATVIDCQGSDAERHRGFHFRNGEGPDAVLAGLTITNGYGPNETDGFEPGSEGGAIRCYMASPTIANCWLIMNRAIPSGLRGVGGAVVCRTSNAVIAGCKFLANRILNRTGWGGALTAADQSAVTLTGCVFSGNWGDNGGGAMLALESRYTVADCVFNGNASSDYGGALYNTELDPTCVQRVTNAVFCGNRSGGYGGAVRLSLFSHAFFSNCAFFGNSAGCYGGGINGATSSRESVSNCTFSGNSVYGNRCQGYGGAIYGGVLRLFNSILWGNSAWWYPEIPGVSQLTKYNCVKDGSTTNGNINLDPLFAGTLTGTWTAAGAYDPFWFKVTFTNAAANWTPGSLVGMFVQPATAQAYQYLVIANTANTVTIWADWDTVNAGASTIAAGTAYTIQDYRLSQVAAGQAAQSPCVDTGSGPASLFFAAGTTRTDGVDDDGVVDMGYHAAAVPLPQSESDFDFDGDVDGVDYGHFAGCFHGAGVTVGTSCYDADLDADKDVDGVDYGLFAGCFNGSGNPPACR